MRSVKYLYALLRLITSWEVPVDNLAIFISTYSVRFYQKRINLISSVYAIEKLKVVPSNCLSYSTFNIFVNIA